MPKYPVQVITFACGCKEARSHHDLGRGYVVHDPHQDISVKNPRKRITFQEFHKITKTEGVQHQLEKICRKCLALELPVEDLKERTREDREALHREYQRARSKRSSGRRGVGIMAALAAAMLPPAGSRRGRR